MNENIKNCFQISVVLPSYNERENIVEAIKRVTKTLDNNLREIIVVDDNSPDETWRHVEELNHPKVKLIRRINEKGLASALATGIDMAKGDIIVWMDCDLGVPPEEVPRLVERIEDYDLAIGSRFIGIGKDLRKRWIAISSHLINFIAQLILGSDVKDYTSGFIAVRREVFNKVRINPKGFGEYFIEFVHQCSKNKFKITEVGYIYGNRAGGVSKSTDNFIIFLKLGFKYFLKVVELRFKKS